MVIETHEQTEKERKKERKRLTCTVIDMNAPREKERLTEIDFE